MSKEDEKIVISVQNQNDEAVKGVTFEVKVNYDCEVEGGEVVRISDSPAGKIYYISVDLLPKACKTVVIKRGE